MATQAASTPEQACDVFIIGGGPAGSATAIILAQAGFNVVLAERDQHPRFHIGESLLPQSLPMFERLGVLDRVRGIGVRKNAAEFVSADGETTARFEFARSLTGGPPYAFQVKREDFDKLVFERAVEVGVATYEGAEAKVLSSDEGGAVVETRHANGESMRFRAEFLIDASGRSTVMAKAHNDKSPDPRNTSAAIFGHFSGVPRGEGERAGDIEILLTNPGWMWRIPLSDGVTSIGYVAPGDQISNRSCGLNEFFADHCRRHPRAATMLANAEPMSQLQATGNFSYRSECAAAAGHFRVGDAFGFIDPIFSTGVHLALASAQEAAEAVIRAKSKSGQARRREFQIYDKRIKARMQYVAWFIYRIQNPVLRGMLLHPRDILGIERAIIALLAGDFSGPWKIRWRVGLFKTLYFVFSIRSNLMGAKHG